MLGAPRRESAPLVPSCGAEGESAAASARRARSSAERPAMVFGGPSGPVGAVFGGWQPPRQNRPYPPSLCSVRSSAHLIEPLGPLSPIGQ